tara:strand:+ start:108 stop:239 length:132 start_codon:yes stop_codon:yes gene_type:complete
LAKGTKNLESLFVIIAIGFGVAFWFGPLKSSNPFYMLWNRGGY